MSLFLLRDIYSHFICIYYHILFGFILSKFILEFGVNGSFEIFWSLTLLALSTPYPQPHPSKLNGFCEEVLGRPLRKNLSIICWKTLFTFFSSTEKLIFFSNRCKSY